MGTHTSISRIISVTCVLAFCTTIDTAEAWVKDYQHFPDGEATVIVERFCRTAGCHYPTDHDWRTAIRTALQAWNEAGADFTFHERAARADDDPCRGNEGEVFIILATPDRLCPGDGPMNFSARTEWRFFPKVNRIYLNAERESSENINSITRLLMHELGHVVGLGHPDEAGQNVQAVMNSRVNYNELQPDDIAGIRALYGGRGPLVGFLENPGDGSSRSGIGVISGWVCEAEVVTLVIDDSAPQEAAYGTERLDTEGTCGDTNNGFGLLFNWNNLGDGAHTVVALVDGVELDRATVMVTTLGEEFLRGATGEYVLEGFPDPNSSVVIEWQESLQNFVIAEFEPPTRPTRCTVKTTQANLDGGQVTVTNPCDGKTLTIKGVSSQTFLCGMFFSFEQDGVQFSSSHFDLTFDPCAGDDGFVPSTITLAVDESSPLDLLEPFQLFYNGRVLFTFP